LSKQQNTTTLRSLQPTVVKNPETLLSLPEGNVGAAERDQWRRINPTECTGCINQVDNVLSLCFGPGQGLGRVGRRNVEQNARLLGNPHLFPNLIEFEFSTSPATIYPAAEGLPEDYRASAIDWVLEISQAIVIYVDTAPGAPTGEPYRILAPIQVGFRCSEAQVDDWVDYLGRRVRPRHRFAVVRFAPRGVQS
jgi:hypothetical protein